MKPFDSFTGTVLPLDRTDVDTDQIMPKQFLSRIERTGFGEFVFFEWCKDPEFEFNQPQYSGAQILVAGRNFGSGSSREHAAWGLQDYGFKVIVAPSFADIFRGNCRQVGVVAAQVGEAECHTLMRLAKSAPDTQFRVDLEGQSITSETLTVRFDIDPVDKDMILRGLDDVEIMREKEAALRSYEARRPSWRPRIDPNRTEVQKQPITLIRPSGRAERLPS